MKVPRGTARSRAQKRKEEKEAGSQVGSALRKAPQLQAKDAPRENCGQGKDSRVGQERSEMRVDASSREDCQRRIYIFIRSARASGADFDRARSRKCAENRD